MITVNIWAVVVVAVVQMVLGFIWYGPLFGKNWGRIIGMDMVAMTPEKKKEMQNKMGPTYLLAFVLSLLTAYILAHFIRAWTDYSGMMTAFVIWLGFVMPIVAGASIWSGKPRKVAWEMFLLTAGYQLIAFMLAGLILGSWM